MRFQLICLVLLFAASDGMCSDSDQEMKMIEEELLNSLYTTKVNKQRLPSWKLSLLNMCRLINDPSRQGDDVWTSDEEGFISREQISTFPDSFSLEKLADFYQLQNLCRILHGGEFNQKTEDYLDQDYKNEGPLKRKSPYILKRQLHINKPRRPYILKRSTLY
ncbi:neurotensin/neuromedin N [Lepisosteus oculatus]|uniref:neurotensin/neuromedin N n=1 Tax=Lepisosteus oculatus TaxID=7918 RepID=UPI0003EA8FFD|nr:PREDICTED: neurotensin/neuromedin N [Lepisosteus oculatus]